MISRENISPSYQLVQNCHSLADFIFEYPELSKIWKETTNSIVSLSVPTEKHLEELSEKLKSKNYFVTKFHEPDINNQLTSICVFGTPEVRKFLSNLPLSLKKYNKIYFEEMSMSKN